MGQPLIITGTGSGGGASSWDTILNAAADLTLANAGFNTTFNQTSAVNWTWANTTAATSGTSQSSPILNINGTYWTGAASATDSWTIKDVVANGTNGTSTLTISHSGSAGAASMSTPALTSSGAVFSNFSGGIASLNFQMLGTNTGFFAASSNISGWVFGGNTIIGTLAGSQPGIQFEQTRGLLWSNTTGCFGGSYPVGLSNPGYSTLNVNSGSNASTLWLTDFSGNMQMGQLVLSTGLLGSLPFVQIGTPPAPTVSKVSGSGAQTWGYKVVAKDAGGNVTAASTEGTVTAQNATLSAAAINKVLVNRQFGAVTYDIYRTTAGTSPSTTGKIATINQNLAAANLVVFDAGSLVLSAAANASGGTTVYTGTITNGTTNNGYIGCIFVVSGFTTGANNGTFTCVASTTTTLTLNNASGVAETHAGTASQTGDGTTAPAVNTTGRISSYSGVTTVSNGVPLEVATVDSIGLVASTGTVTLYAVPATGAGQYRISWNAKITTAGTSPVIGPLTLTYTDPDGTVCAMVVPSSNSAGTTSASGNSANSTTATGVMLGCDVLLNCKASTNIQYSFPVSGTVGTGAWNLHIKCEALG